MSDVRMTDKIVENKLLTIVGRVGMSLMALSLPFIAGWAFGISNEISNVQERVSIIETKQNIQAVSNSNAREELNVQQNRLNKQIEALRAQNINILQAIARIETKIERLQQDSSREASLEQ